MTPVNVARSRLGVRQETAPWVSVAGILCWPRLK
jgi:hypothetical protein